MFKDYYKILEIPPHASAQEIKAAYRNMSIKWHPDRNPNQDVTGIMQNINEAYAILKDEVKRARYDREYQQFKEQTYQSYATSQNCSEEESSYDIQDETLKEDIAAARKYAKELVEEFMESFKKASEDAAKGAWSGAKSYIYTGIFLFVVGGIIRTCAQDSFADELTSQQYYSPVSTPSVVSTPQAVVSTHQFQVPDSWTKYLISNEAFSISVPSSVELRNEYDEYTRLLKGVGITCNSDVVVFQQKGLSSQSKEAYKHYCRIMIQHATGNAGDFLRADEIEKIDYDTKEFLKELVLGELGGFSLLAEPTYKWININGTKAIEIKYRRSGTDSNTTSCTMYLLFNYDEMVKMIISYREQERELWQRDLDNMIKTFNWESINTNELNFK